MDAAEPFDIVQAKANAGDAEAQNAMGRLVSQAGGANAFADAEQWFRRAAEQGLAKAKHNLGVLHWQREPASQEAVQWLADAAADGWPESMFVLGALLEERGDTEGARKLYLHAAQRGHARAQDAMSRIHFKGQTPQDYERAKNWAEAAAQQGIPEAFTRLGTIFHEGLGTPRDPQRATAHFLEAAKRGHSGGQLMIGVALHMGIGIPAERIEAAHWLLRSADQGNELADAYLKAKAGMKDLLPNELEEAKRRASQPLPPPTSFRG